MKKNEQELTAQLHAGLGIKQAGAVEPGKHTPEPWEFAFGAVYRQDTLHDEGSIRIALMDRNEAHTTPCERDANGRLIATAPELLAAVRWACAWANGWEPTALEREAFHARCLEAIAKATGGDK